MALRSASSRSARSGGTAQPAARMPIANGAFLTQIRSQGMNGHNNREGGKRMLKTTIAGSLPKPAWLAEPRKLWPAWRPAGEELEQAKRDATLLWLKAQEDAGLDIGTDGEQSRQHFVHGFLEFVEGIDFSRKVKMGIRNNRYEAMVPVVTGPLRLKGRVHQMEASLSRKHTKNALKITLPGPMTIVDTIADQHYGDKVKLAMAFAELLKLLKGKDVLIGVIDVASDQVETPAEVAATIAKAAKYVPLRHLYPCTNCGMAPMDRDIALKKLDALVAGTRLARKKLK